MTFLTEDIQAIKRSVAELISKRAEPVDETGPKPPRKDAGMPSGDVPPSSRSGMIDSYPLCNLPIVPTRLRDM